MGFISHVLQVVPGKGFNLFLLGNNIRGFVTWHSSLWALSEPLMISTALAGTREKQKQMKMKVSRNVEVWFYFLYERQVFTMRFLEFLVVQTHPSGVACWRHFFPWGSEFCSTSEWSFPQLFVVPKIGRLCMLVQSPNLVQVLCSASNFTGQQIHQSKRSILTKEQSTRSMQWFKL